MATIVPSILAADLARLGDEVAAAEAAGADWIHVDVMDGRFVPNLGMGPATVEAVRRSTSLPINVHLMIEAPDAIIESFARAGATHVSVHAEATVHLIRSLELVRSLGLHPGIALAPTTSLSAIEWSLDHADYIDVLAVNPGFGGQDFLPSTFAKVRALRAEILRRGLSTVIEADGGIGQASIGTFAAAGVDAFVVGSALFGRTGYPEVVAALRREAEAGLRRREDGASPRGVDCPTPQPPLSPLTGASSKQGP